MTSSLDPGPLSLIAWRITSFSAALIWKVGVVGVKVLGVVGVKVLGVVGVKVLGVVGVVVGVAAAAAAAAVVLVVFVTLG